jgi:phosphoacetylglucosamine mutase
LHHAAEEFDIGVYFEANGHGTVLFSRRALEAFRKTEGKTTDEIKALNMLFGFSELINQTVGDALSDLLMVEAILAHQHMTLDQWNASYTDLPSRQEKVKVQNRTLFIPIKADTELARPEGLQPLINAESAKFKNGRCFVRPSGTEDIVRVYAEADSAEHADLLAYTICGIIFDRFGGVGERPSKFPKLQ